jgi:hypothetical protein
MKKGINTIALQNTLAFSAISLFGLGIIMLRALVLALLTY